MNKQKEKEVERVEYLVRRCSHTAFDETCLECRLSREIATDLVDNGIRSAEGFEIKHDYDHNGVDYVDCSTIIPKEYEDDTTR